MHIQELRGKFDVLFDNIFEPSVLFILENIVSIIQLTVEGHSTNTTSDSFKNQEKISSVMWGYIANTNMQGRDKFNVFLLSE